MPRNKNFLNPVLVGRPANFLLAVLLLQPACLLTDLAGMRPASDVEDLRNFAPRIALAAAEGWLLGCNAFLEERPEITETNCADQQGGEFFALYLSAATSAVRNLFPDLAARGQLYYRSQSVSRCVERVRWNAYWLTRTYLDSSHPDGEAAAGDDHLAESTYVGVQGTRSCVDELEGSGRIIEAGGRGL